LKKKELLAQRHVRFKPSPAMLTTALPECSPTAKLSTTTDLNKLRRIKPSLMDNEQCQGIDAGCTMNDEFLPSDGTAPAANEEDDADDCASIIVTNAPLSIEPQSIAKETTLNNHPLLSCNPIFEVFEAMYPNRETMHTLTMVQQSFEAMEPLESLAPRKKKSIHHAMKVGVASVNGQLNITPALVGWQQSSCEVPRYLRHCGYIAMCGCSCFMLEKKDKRNVCPIICL
jgi:hypothetical protein